MENSCSSSSDRVCGDGRWQHHLPRRLRQVLRQCDNQREPHHLPQRFRQLFRQCDDQREPHHLPRRLRQILRQCHNQREPHRLSRCLRQVCRQCDDQWEPHRLPRRFRQILRQRDNQREPHHLPRRFRQILRLLFQIVPAWNRTTAGTPPAPLRPQSASSPATASRFSAGGVRRGAVRRSGRAPGPRPAVPVCRCRRSPRECARGFCCSPSSATPVPSCAH